MPFFPVPGFTQLAREWWQQRPHIKQRKVNGSVVSQATSGDAAFDATTWHGSGEEVSVEERLKIVESNLEMLRNEHRRFEQDIKQTFGAMRQDVKHERVERERVDEDVQTKLRALGVGGIYREWIGVLWFGLGVILATLSPETARLL